MDRKSLTTVLHWYHIVALRKESVDRKFFCHRAVYQVNVALRKESVDRKFVHMLDGSVCFASLSARRAWIEKSIIL